MEAYYKSISAFLIAGQPIIKIGFKIPVRPVAGKVAEASLLSHGHIQLPTTRAVCAERMENKKTHMLDLRLQCWLQYSY